MSDADRILEQYKLYVEMTDRVTARRIETNKFFISIISALIAFVTFLLTMGICPGYEKLVLVFFSILGLFLVGVWLLNINTYRQLNSGKFKVIHEIEKKLPFPCYDREWKLLGRGKSKEYKTLTKIERFVPLILSIPYFLLLLYSIFS